MLLLLHIGLAICTVMYVGCVCMCVGMCEKERYIIGGVIAQPFTCSCATTNLQVHKHHHSILKGRFKESPAVHNWVYLVVTHEHVCNWEYTVRANRFLCSEAVCIKSATLLI